MASPIRQSTALPWFIPFVIVAVLFTGCATSSPTVEQTKPASTQMATSIPLAPISAATSSPSSRIVETPTRVIYPSDTPTKTSTAAPETNPVVLTGAGDISVCGTMGSEQTAELIDALPGEVFTAGDNTNESGKMFQYQDCFEKTWGRFKNRLHPSPGNHDYMVPDAADYYAYFGAAAGDPGKGYYSYDLGDWHIVALNSNCSAVGCGAISAQVKWLQADLDAHPSKCTLAYWHHPRFSSGLAGTFGMYNFWNVLYDHGVDIVVNGNDHDYERFAPQDALGNPDDARGIREFVVGTGGASQRPFGQVQPNSEVRNTGAYGVIKFTLYPDYYEWVFLPVAGADFTDSGSAPCHN
ncbi:MAG: metallophosphoesterase [Anaerolineaceae bacterium]|nr:metallophosphoesterase [Anaerolineaceae bacterium]